MRFTSAQSHALIIAIASLLAAFISQADHRDYRDIITLQAASNTASNSRAESDRHGKAQAILVRLTP
jgi:hypothetical protein